MGRAHHAAHGGQIRTAVTLSEAIPRQTRQRRRYTRRADELRISGRLQPLPTDRPPLPPQWGGRRHGLSAQLHTLLPAHEWITKNPFRYYKLKEDEVQTKEHLTAHELELLTRKALDHRLARIRDVFVFCCLTGLAFADADQLRCEHLSQDDEGRWWIHKPREKTSVMSRIPLLPIPLEILHRYEHDEICVARSRVLPTPSNQKMNAYMKETAIDREIGRI